VRVDIDHFAFKNVNDRLERAIASIGDRANANKGAGPLFLNKFI
jgi:hypothetical protein